MSQEARRHAARRSLLPNKFVRRGGRRAALPLACEGTRAGERRGRWAVANSGSGVTMHEGVTVAIKETTRIRPVSVNCATTGCSSSFAFGGGSANEFFAAFEEAHFEGWLCLVATPFDLKCPTCNQREFRRYQTHQLLRHKLTDQPEWKRDLALAVWAAMPERKDEYLRETEMPIAMRALLGRETLKSAHVRDAVEKIERAFASSSVASNGAEASRLAQRALRSAS